MLNLEEQFGQNLFILNFSYVFNGKVYIINIENIAIRKISIYAFIFYEAV